jgi:hypothetical protein
VKTPMATELLFLTSVLFVSHQNTSRNWPCGERDRGAGKAKKDNKIRVAVVTADAVNG